MKKTSMNRLAALWAGAALAVTVACGEYAVPNFNNESLDGLIENPNPIRIATAVQGLQVAARAGSAGDVLNKGVQGREAYVLTPETPGSVTERLIGPLTSVATGGASWASEYIAIKQGNVILRALGGVQQGMTRLSPGFTGFTTPTTFRQANRALRARVNLYQGNYADVLTDLTGSFITTTPGTLGLGIYHAFSTTSGDITNTNFDPQPRAYFGHPSLLATTPAPLYELRGDGTPDLRVGAKTFRRAAGPFAFSGVSSDVGLRVYNDIAASIPIIRNEELILIRAEARLRTGDRTGALSDVNFIRQQSGGLPAIADPGDPGLDNQILYNRLWSLLFEGHRWVDMRRWGRLAELPRDLPTHRIFRRYPIPDAECAPRTPRPSPGCDSETGL
jgi:hypothetical protein